MVDKEDQVTKMAGLYGKGSPGPRLETFRVGGGVCHPHPVTGRN